MNSENGIVSIVVSTYNEEKFLNKTISSLLCQDYSNIEIVITDDGSNDKTIDILKGYSADPRFNIKFGSHTGNVGLNLNESIRRSRGEFIAVLGADDLWEENKLSRQLEFMKEENVVCSNGIVIDAVDKIFLPSVLHFRNKKYIDIKDLFIENCILASSVLARKFVLIDCLMFDEEIGNRSEDYALWFRIAHKYRIRYIDEKLVKYRVHGNNLSLRSSESKIEVHLRNLQLIEQNTLLHPELGMYAEKGKSQIYGKLSRLYYSENLLDSSLYWCKLLLRVDRPRFSPRFIKYLCFYIFLYITKCIVPARSKLNNHED